VAQRLCGLFKVINIGTLVSQVIRVSLIANIKREIFQRVRLTDNHTRQRPFYLQRKDRVRYTTLYYVRFAIDSRLIARRDFRHIKDPGMFLAP